MTARWWKAWPWLLLALCAITIVVLAIVAGRPDPPPSERRVERRLSVLSARAGFPLHSARCVRDAVLPRTFACVVEGPFDAHLAWRVLWQPDGSLEVRRPDGTRLPF